LEIQSAKIGISICNIEIFDEKKDGESEPQWGRNQQNQGI
jgi:hypothetical protein